MISIYYYRDSKTLQTIAFKRNISKTIKDVENEMFKDIEYDNIIRSFDNFNNMLIGLHK